MLRHTQAEAKPSGCILCGRQSTSFCNSHSVPRMILKNISDNGKVLQANALVGLEILDTEKGVNNSGTFHIICNDCDSQYFRNYEDPRRLEQYPDDIIMAEIALKNSLIQLGKRKQEVELYKELEKMGIFTGMNIINTIHSLDIKEYTEEIIFYKRIIDENIKNGFQVLFWKELPYKTPIAAQSGIALEKDMEGAIVNNIADLSESIRIQNIHIGIFPMEKKTIVLVFYHKRDKKYRKLRHQIKVLSDDTALMYINWLVIKYTENYYLSKGVRKIIESNAKIQELSRENNGAPNLGMVDLLSWINYKPIEMDEIPNLLSQKYAVEG